MNVFISYADERRPVADAIAVGLAQDGHEVFFDRDNLPAGDDYHARIREAIARADLFIFLVSPESLEPTAYTLTELALARSRWRNPSGRVLPIDVADTNIADVPPYLRSVTVLKPRGDVVAEVLARTAEITRGRRKRRIAWGAVAFCGAVALGTLAARFVVSVPSPAPCLLTADLRARAPSQTMRATLIEVGHGGNFATFLVSAGGQSDIHVGPLTSRDAAWTIEARDADGAVVGRQDVRGCARAPQAVSLGTEIEVVLRPR